MEQISSENEKLSDTDNKNIEVIEKLECPICLQICIHPVRLPCNHIFCFLCIKGVASKSKKCAMCRSEIPIEFIIHPSLVNDQENDSVIKSDDNYQWFYEGRNGWWQYDERTSQELEVAFQNEAKDCSVLVAGQRKIKRDLASTTKKGIAGLRILSNSLKEEDISSTSMDRSESVLNLVMENLNTINITEETTPAN